MLINMILTAILVGFTTALTLILSVGVAVYVIKRRITTTILSFITSPDKDTASPLALLCQSIASIFGAEISSHLKATFLGLQSVEAKNERKEAAAGIIGGNSILGALATSFPAVGKKLGKNPALAALVDMAVSRFSGGVGTQSGTNVDSQSPRFKL